MKRPIVWFAACWIAGCGAGFMMEWDRLLFMVIGLLLLIPLAARKKLLGIRLGLVCCVGFAIAAIYSGWAEARNTTELAATLEEMEAISESPVIVQGTIVTTVSVDGDRADFTLDAHMIRLADREPANISESFIVYVKLTQQSQVQEVEQWRRGDEVTLQGTLKLPNEAGNFDGFDYRKFLHTRQIHWLIDAKGTGSVEQAPTFHWSAIQLLRWTDELRASLEHTLEQLFPQGQSGYMKGLILGQQDDLDPEQFQQFSKLGLTHILAVSGLHVAVFVACVTWLLRLVGLTKETSLLVVMLLIPIYVLLTGASPSVIRAGIMAMIALYAVRRNLLKDALHLLAITAFVMLVWNPYYVFDVSFQLSFAVTAGLIWGVPLMGKLLPARPKALSGAISVTLVAQAVSFPLSIYYFNQFSLLSFVANFVFVPFISFIVLPAGTIAMLLALIHPSIAMWLAWITGKMNDVTFRIVESFNDADRFVSIWATPAPIWIAAYYAAFAALLSGWAKRREGAAGASNWTGAVTNIRPARIGFSAWKLPLIGVFMVFLLWYGYRFPSLGDDGLVQFIDVGQGDCTLIVTPGKRTILVDGGGTVSFRKADEQWRNRLDPFEVGKKVLVPLLKKRGVQQIDELIISHEDEDHIGGLQAVLEQIPVNRILFNGTLKESPNVKKLFATALRKHIPLYYAHEGLTLKPDQHTTLTFLYPKAPSNPGDSDAEVRLESDQNESSIVFLLDMYGRTFLFTGDIGKVSESDMLRNWQTNAGIFESSSASNESIDIMKVAHHGSKHSSSADWLAYWKPKVSVISVGKSNVYGHPSPDALERLKSAHSEVYRTDRQGELQVKVNDRGIEIRAKRAQNGRNR